MKYLERTLSCHVDVDNLWIQQQEFGIRRSFDPDVIFTESLPLSLAMFRQQGIRATYFIVGRDLELESCQEFCREAVKQGHYLANHTLSHLPSFYSLSINEKKREILACQERIENLTGVKPLGFRAPGYFTDPGLFRLLLELGYLYDSSIMPGWYCPALATYMRLNGASKLNKRFGKLSYMFSSREPYSVYREGDRELVEIPIYTAGGMRFPVHTSVLQMFGERYSAWMCDVIKKDASAAIYLFHAIDWLESKYAPELAKFVPALRLPVDERLTLYRKVLSSFSDYKSILLEEEILRGK